MLGNADIAIAGLYRASAGLETWGSSLTRIVNDLGAKGAQMVGVNQVNRSISFSYVSEDVDCALEVEYIRKYHALDPRIPRLVSRPFGAWLYDQDEFDRAVFDLEPYYRDYLAPADSRFSATVRLFEDDNDVVLMAIIMGLESPGFGEAHREYLTRISHHFTDALRIFRQTQKLAQGNSAGEALISRIKKPTLLIDPSRLITSRNQQAISMLGERSVLTERNGRLAAADSRDEDALTICVVELASSIRLCGSGERRIVRLHAANAQRFAASLIAFDPPSSMHAFGPLPQIMVTLHGAPTVPEPDTYLWQAAFDLTPAEARMAAQIFQGASVPAAAKAMGISPNTANTHLDRVFAKTGANTQPKLIRVLMLATD